MRRGPRAHYCWQSYLLGVVELPVLGVGLGEVGLGAVVDEPLPMEPDEEPDELPELPVEDGRPAYAQLEHLANGLPPTERAAVVLRYGYDFAYDDIATALGSTPEAARQAASSGIRRLRASGGIA